MAQADLTRVASNIGALNSLWALQSINKQLGIHQTRLSTGKRINSAADDPAGLTIATKLDSRSQGLKVALDNIGDAKNLLAVAEGGIGRISDIIIQMKNKAAQAASDTMGTAERSAIKEQLTAYAKQIDDIVEQTSWNGNKLIDGSKNAGVLTFQTGADSGDVTQVSGISNLYATAKGTGTGLELASISGGTVTIGSIMDAGDVLTDGSEATWDTVAANYNENLTALAAGQYQIEVVAGGTTGSSSTIRLLDMNGNAQYIDTVGDGVITNATAQIATGVDLSAAPTTFNFGNGLTISIEGGMANGTYTSALTVSDDGEVYNVRTQGAGGAELTDAASYSELMSYLETKLDDVNEVMAKIGAFTGRLTFKEDQVTASQINVEASYNRIMNANMAEEQVNASKYMILQQTSIAMLAQANQSPQFLLSLFQ
jgi:flagellin